MKLLASFIAIHLCLINSGGASEACYFERINEVRELASKEFDARFTLEDNIQINIDKMVTQRELRPLLECAFNASKSREKVERVTGSISFAQEVYQMYGNDYSFGVVGEKVRENGSRFFAKMTAKISSDGNVRVFDILVLEQNNRGKKWLRLEDDVFVRRDKYCLECHSSQLKNGFLYGKNLYKKVL